MSCINRRNAEVQEHAPVIERNIVLRRLFLHLRSQNWFAFLLEFPVVEAENRPPPHHCKGVAQA